MLCKQPGSFTNGSSVLASKESGSLMALWENQIVDCKKEAGCLENTESSVDNYYAQLLQEGAFPQSGSNREYLETEDLRDPTEVKRCIINQQSRFEIMRDQRKALKSMAERGEIKSVDEMKQKSLINEQLLGRVEIEKNLRLLKLEAIEK